MAFNTKIVAIIIIVSICTGCLGESVPPEQAASEWEEQARAYEQTSEWEKAANAWGEAAESWENQADMWEDADDIKQASETREKAASDWEAQAEDYEKAYEWKKAVKAYERAAEVWEKAAESWESIECIQKPKECYGSVAGCWFNIGGIYRIWLNNREKAAESYEKAAEIYEANGFDVLAELCQEWASEASVPEDDTESEVEDVEMLVLESQEILSDGSVEVCILNAGSAIVWIVEEHHNGVQVEGALRRKLPGNSTTCFTLAGMYAPGDDAVLVTEEGTIIKFTIKDSTSLFSFLIHKNGYHHKIVASV